MDNDLLAFFDKHNLLLLQLVGSENDVQEIIRSPLLAMGSHETDYHYCPNPDHYRISAKPLSEMTLDDYHDFLRIYITQAEEVGLMRCFVCNNPYTPEVERDMLFVDLSIICWLTLHNACRKYFQRDLKGRHPFEVTPRESIWLDLVAVPAHG